ncbi:hypothetical protein [Nocardia sp. NPDC057440]|uniref:hypothetical protein n=1 Tax=Nocardia sp. NPDC057440 TaxID=3346134 RepID=UPI00366E8F89
MNPDIKEKWVTALRSGEFKQGRAMLRSKNDQYCCLGVLSELAAKEGVVSRALDINEYGYRYGSNSWSTLPSAVASWAGLPWSDDIGMLPEKAAERYGHPCLAELNDSGHYSFPVIADVIEEWL